MLFRGGVTDSTSQQDDSSVVESPKVVGAEYNATDISTLFQDLEGTVPVSENGQKVMLVKDVSGNNLNAYASSLETAPTYNNGKLVFDGVRTYLTMPSASYYSSAGDILAFAQLNITGKPTDSTPYSILDDDDGVVRNAQNLVVTTYPKSVLFTPKSNFWASNLSADISKMKNFGVSVDSTDEQNRFIARSVDTKTNSGRGNMQATRTIPSSPSTLEIGRRKTGSQYAKMELIRLVVKSSGSDTELQALSNKYK